MSLEIQGLTKTYHQGAQKIEVLRGVEVKIQTGEIVAILGKSGSGKSTLLAILAALDPPDSGTIFVDGQNILSMRESDLTVWRGKKLGFVFQQIHLIPHLTAWENVHLPLEIGGQPNPEAATNLLVAVGLGDRAGHFPKQLSGGECQRVAIARALIIQPKLLLADEPSGSLDADTGEQVLNVFFTQVRRTRTTTLLVTHNEDLANRCDRKFVLSKGLLQEL